MADGATLLIVSPSGTGFQARFEIHTRATAPAADVDVISNATAAVALSGTLVSGDRWSSRCRAATGAVRIRRGRVNHLGGMAAGLAAAINADKTPRIRRAISPPPWATP